ncbi:MAG: hypothetical protein ABJG68_03270 [Crocinitomicaceae bacterium]
MPNSDKRGGLGERFEGFGAAPSDQLWGDISAQLDEKNGKKRVAWWWFFGGLAASIVTLVLLWPSSLESDHLIEQKDLTCTENKYLAQDIQVEEVVPEIIEAQDAQVEIDLGPDAFRGVDQNENIVRYNYPSTPLVKIEEWRLEGDVNLSPLVEIPEIEIDLEKRKVPPCAGYTSPKYKNRIWEFGFDVAYWEDISIPNKAYEIPPSNSLTTNSDIGTTNTINGSLESYGSTFNVTPGVLKYGSVNRRINVNFNAGRYISNRFMLHSGLGFQRSSYYGYYDEPEYIDVKTSLSSLSIPLKFSVDVMRKYKFKWRFNAGIHNEVSILEKAAVNYSNGGYGSTRNFTTGYFGALQADTELQFRLRTGLFLTVKPSYRYYFRQAVPTEHVLIRKDHWLGGAIGLAWNF